MAIVRFKCKDLKLFYTKGSTKAIWPDYVKRLCVILTALTSATTSEMLRTPAFKKRPLKGTLTGYCSIWVNGAWRVTFRL
ncbi:type II toxin-antitoxin system RelE/ParE family toxin [Bartonella phoceensis]|uniref:type II toxin-antitoxin system RelE/ParE family toxin n=1 Tax=Bartonella phoceensis TaxID=270249 RepID=UPI001FE768C5|nr:type II toxin-antitoxin system RelE/ParE family toxin [Bartonella phoceensis]